MMSEAIDARCPNCNAAKGAPCTQPTETGRKPMSWFHSSRIDAALHGEAVSNPAPVSTQHGIRIPPPQIPKSPASTPRVLRSDWVALHTTLVMPGSQFEDGLPRYFVPSTVTPKEANELTAVVLETEAASDELAKRIKQVQDAFKITAGEMRTWSDLA